MHTEPLRILVAGDFHRDLNAIEIAATRAVTFDCDTILQVGDFGWFPQRSDSDQWLGEVDEIMTRHGLQLGWIDGNHDDHDAIDRLTAEHGYTAPIRQTERIWYLPRGARCIWHDVTFAFCGGAASFDRDARLERESSPRTLWWPQEAVTDEDVNRLVDDGPAGVLLTHDVPSGYGAPRIAATVGGWQPTLDNQARLAHIAAALAPKLLFHGHWHLAHRHQIHGCTVQALDCEITPGAYWVLDLSTEADAT